jgi:hypothetical protein
LGDSAVNPRYIETLFGEGYRFIPIPQERRTFPVKSRNARKIDSLAVLPFVNESADPELEFLNRRLKFTLALVEIEQPIGTDLFAACFALSGPSGTTGKVSATPVDLSQCAALEDAP